MENERGYGPLLKNAVNFFVA